MEPGPGQALATPAFLVATLQIAHQPRLTRPASLVVSHIWPLREHTVLIYIESYFWLQIFSPVYPQDASSDPE